MISADFIVIGGGIAGISAAAELAREASVIVLEGEDQLGYHSTGRSAAIFIRNYGNSTLRSLNSAAEPFFHQPEGVADSSLLSPRGEMLIAAEDQLDKLAAHVVGSEGLDHLTPDEACELVPILRKDKIAAAIIERDAQDIDVDRMLQGLARLLRHRNGQIETQQRVKNISRRGSEWLIQSTTNEYSTPTIINAAGAWADDIAHLANVRTLGLTALRRSAALLPAPAGYEIKNWPLFGSINEDWYAKPDAGCLLVSPADEDPVDPHDTWADDMVIAEGIDRYEQAVTVPVTQVTHTWAGLRVFTPDRTPLTGFDLLSPSFFWLAGQGGYGIQTAPALAKLTADLCLGKSPKLSDEILAALSPSRFHTPL